MEESMRNYSVHIMRSFKKEMRENGEELELMTQSLQEIKISVIQHVQQTEWKKNETPSQTQSSATSENKTEDNILKV